jgi:hypothetical protein
MMTAYQRKKEKSTVNQAMNPIQPAVPNKFQALLPFLLDLIIPVIVYHVLHHIGLSDFIALTASGMAAGMTTVIETILRRRLDGIGLLVVIEIVLSIALMFWTNDPRILLIKPSFYVAAAAIYAWTTCFVGRPFSYEVAKPMATKGDPIRQAAYELAWERSRPFQRGEKIMTAGWGIVMMLEAALRIVVVFRFSEHEIGMSLIFSQLPGLLLIVLAIMFTKRCIAPLKKIVDRYCLEIAEERKPPTRLK